MGSGSGTLSVDREPIPTFYNWITADRQRKRRGAPALVKFAAVVQEDPDFPRDISARVFTPEFISFAHSIVSEPDALGKLEQLANKLGLAGAIKENGLTELYLLLTWADSKGISLKDYDLAELEELARMIADFRKLSANKVRQLERAKLKTQGEATFL